MSWFREMSGLLRQRRRIEMDYRAAMRVLRREMKEIGNGR